MYRHEHIFKNRIITFSLRYICVCALPFTARRGRQLKENKSKMKHCKIKTFLLKTLCCSVLYVNEDFLDLDLEWLNDGSV